jgi:hypothetical protein
MYGACGNPFWTSMLEELMAYEDVVGETAWASGHLESLVVFKGWRGSSSHLVV